MLQALARPRAEDFVDGFLAGVGRAGDVGRDSATPVAIYTLELFRPGPKFDFPGPRAAMLVVDMQIGPGDLVG